MSYLLATLLADGFHIDQILFCPIPYTLLRLYLAENREQGLILNIHDKSTSILGDYDTNEYVWVFIYKMAIQPIERRYHNQEKQF